MDTLIAQDGDAAVPHAAVRLKALNMMATSPADPVAEHVLHHLEDPQREVQLRVIQILEDRCEPRAIAPMLMLLAASRTDAVLTAALIKTLGVLRASAALAPICQLLEDGSTSSIVRLQAALALGDMAPVRL